MRITTNKIEIGYNRRKLRKGSITSIGFGIVGLMLFIFSTDKNSFYNNPFFKYGGIVLSVIAFWYGILFFLRKLVNKNPAIVIDDNGIQDNSNLGFSGLICWEDIKEVRKARSVKQEFLVVEVRNPKFYIDRQKGYSRKQGMKYNLKHFGSPHTIYTVLLNCTLEELIMVVEEKLTSHQ